LPAELWRGEEPSQFIFDLMEPERPNIDLAALEFVKGPVFDPADFWNSQRRRLSVESGNGADGRGEGFCIENLWSRPAGVDGLC
jgi:hypothetical protein